MTTIYIQALGNLLATYQSDLIYIRDFHRFKNGKLSKSDYFRKSKGNFKSFLAEYGVARNVDKTKVDILLKLTINWVTKNNPSNVDSFANQLKSKNLTFGKLMTSLASKNLFLNDPWTILPLDGRVKRAVNLPYNTTYAQYLPLAVEFKKKNVIDIEKSLTSVRDHLTIIEAAFEKEINNLRTIRYNRFVDKILWTIGKND